MSSPFNLQSLYRHFNELRVRLIKATLVFLLACIICYQFIDQILPILIAPAGRLVFTSPGDAFAIYMGLTVVLGALLSSPYTCYQVWAFISQALKPNERQFVAIFAPLSLFFFLSGCAFAYFVAMPMSYKFLMSFASDYLVPMVTVNSYLDFLGNMVLAFGGAFQLPLILAFLAKIGIATPEYLRQKRRHAIMIILIVAAILTPPDVISQLLLAVPLLVLYEVGIIFVKVTYKPRV